MHKVRLAIQASAGCEQYPFNEEHKSIVHKKVGFEEDIHYAAEILLDIKFSVQRLKFSTL